ncbi:MAG: hypothetical protein JNK57_18295 [Planctomycetaceae bacterium]|nr:hypothetical protein [Planctomycetaceae bacterium]
MSAAFWMVLCDCTWAGSGSQSRETARNNHDGVLHTTTPQRELGVAQGPSRT